MSFETSATTGSYENPRVVVIRETLRSGNLENVKGLFGGSDQAATEKAQAILQMFSDEGDLAPYNISRNLIETIVDPESDVGKAIVLELLTKPNYVEYLTNRINSVTTIDDLYQEVRNSLGFDIGEGQYIGPERVVQLMEDCSDELVGKIIDSGRSYSVEELSGRDSSSLLEQIPANNNVRAKFVELITVRQQAFYEERVAEMEKQITAAESIEELRSLLSILFKNLIIQAKTVSTQQLAASILHVQEKIIELKQSGEDVDVEARVQDESWVTAISEGVVVPPIEHGIRAKVIELLEKE